VTKPNLGNKTWHSPFSLKVPFESSSKKRIKWEIARFEEWLDNLAKQEDSPLIEKIEKTLNKAKEASSGGDPMLGWYLSCFHTYLSSGKS
jgi:hypothetical protein